MLLYNFIYVSTYGKKYITKLKLFYLDLETERL